MRTLQIAIILVLVTCFAFAGYCAEVKRTGEVIDVEGNVSLENVSGGRTLAEIGAILNEGDLIETDDSSWVMVRLNGEEAATVEIDENAQVVLSELVADTEKGTQKTMLDVAIGKILIKAQKLRTDKCKFEVKTPTSIVGVRGTTFSVEVEAVE